MPEFITEEQYLAVQDIIDNPPPGTTDYHVAEWKKHQNRYKDQQFRAGIKDLTPNITSQKSDVQYEQRKAFADIYEKGIENYDVSKEPNGQFLTTPEAIARRVNRNYLSTIYQNYKIDSTNHDIFRTDFAKKYLNREDILSDKDFFDAVKPFVKQKALDDENDAQIQQSVIKNYYEGKPLSQVIADNPTINEARVRDLYDGLDNVIAPYRPKIDSALNVLERRAKPEVKELYAQQTGKTLEEIDVEDNAVVEDFARTLINVHPSNRAKVLKRMMGDAVRTGKTNLKEAEGIYQEVAMFFDEALTSAKNVFEGYDAYQRMQAEVKLTDINFQPNQTVTSTNFTEIKDIKDARTFILDKILNREYTPAVGPGAQPFIPPTNEIVLDNNTAKLLRDAKSDLLALTELDRDVQKLQKAVDPFREGWKTDIATTLGSSLGIMGVYSLGNLAGPVGTGTALSFVGSLYTGLNYEQIREKYPDLAPDKARNVALASGGIEALLDLGQYKIISNAFKKLGIKETVDMAGRGVLDRFTRKAASTTAKTYIFEFGTEMLQEGTRPVVQSIFAQFDEEYNINSAEEFKDWIDAAPHIAIGMAPLAIFGGLGAGSKTIFSDRAFKKSVMAEGALKAYGLSDEQISEVQGFVNNNMFDAARNRIKELSQSEEVITRRGEVLDSIVNNLAVIEGADNIRAFNDARRMGIVPKYTTNERGQYILEDGKVLPDQNAYIQYTRSKLNEAETQYSQEVADIIAGRVEATGGIDIDDLNERTRIIGRVKGLSENQLTAYDNIFGKDEFEQRSAIENLIVSIADRGVEAGVSNYITQIYDNIPSDIRNSLGSNKKIGVENLTRLIFNQSANVLSENDRSNVTVNIQDTVAEGNIQFRRIGAKGIIGADSIAAIEIIGNILKRGYENNQTTNLQKVVNDFKALITLKPENRLKAARKLESDIKKIQEANYGLSEDLYKELGIGDFEYVTIDDVASGEEAQFIRTIEDFFKSQYGITTNFIKGIKGDMFPYGLTAGDGNTFYVNVDRLKGKEISFVMGHEFSHTLQIKYPDIWADIKDVLINEVDQKRFKEYKKTIEAKGSYKADQLESEFVADVFGSRFADSEFWTTLTSKLNSSNPTLAKDLIKYAKEFFQNVKNALTNIADRVIQRKYFNNVEKVESAIISGMLKAIDTRSEFGRDVQDSELMRMAGGSEVENRSVDYVARKLRDQINYVMGQIREAGGVAVGRERLVATLIEPQTRESFDALTKNKQQSYNRRIEREYREGRNIGRALRNLSKSLYSAVLKQKPSLKLFAEVEGALNYISAKQIATVQPLSFDEYKQLIDNPAEANNKLREYINIINDSRKSLLEKHVNDKLNEIYKKVLDQKEVQDNEVLNSVFNSIYNALFGDIVDIRGKLNTIYNQLYTKDGIPVSLPQIEFEKLVTDYHIYKTFGGWDQRSIDESEAAINTAIKWSRAVLETGIEDIQIINPAVDQQVLNSIDEIVSNPSTVTSITPDIAVVGPLLSYADDHLTFASILELISPSDIAGRPITPSVQRLSDSFIDAYHNIQDEVHENQDNLIRTIESIFELKDSVEGAGLLKKRLVRQATLKKMYKLLTDKNIKVSINGKDTNITQAFAAYLLNVADQGIHKEQLNNAGITDDVISSIAQQIDPKMDELRVQLRKDLVNTINRTNMRFREIGKPVIDVNEFFFPVEIKSTSSSIINGFDIAFGVGIKPEAIEDISDQSSDLELDLKNQTVNIFTMYNSHSYSQIHSSNVAAPVIAAKRIFSHPAVRAKLETHIGNGGIGRLFGFINALEFGGSFNNEMSKETRKYVSELVSGTARASLGFNLRTYFVNAMSLTNVLQDTSIPFGIKIKALINTIGNLSDLPKTYRNKVIQRRIRAGANALLAAAKGNLNIDNPNLVKTFSDISLEAIGEIDSFFLTFSALVAHEAYYEIGKQEGLSGDELSKFAQEGMIRTITKTSQPNMAATKAYIEQTSNPIVRTISLFLSEPRKALGLEYTAFKKAYSTIFHIETATKEQKMTALSQLAQIVFVNHVILGTGSYFLRELANLVLAGEDPGDDIEEWWISMLLGPLSGLVLVGDAFQLGIKKIYNMIAEEAELPKARVFGGQSAIQRTIDQSLQFSRVLSADRTPGEIVSDIGNSLEGIGAAFNQSTVSSTGSIVDAIGDVIKATIERE